MPDKIETWVAVVGFILLAVVLGGETLALLGTGPARAGQEYRTPSTRNIAIWSRRE